MSLTAQRSYGLNIDGDAVGGDGTLRRTAMHVRRSDVVVAVCSGQKFVRRTRYGRA
jgi:hypothetical protein